MWAFPCAGWEVIVIPSHPSCPMVLDRLALALVMKMLAERLGPSTRSQCPGAGENSQEPMGCKDPMEVSDGWFLFEIVSSIFVSLSFFSIASLQRLGWGNDLDERTSWNVSLLSETRFCSYALLCLSEEFAIRPSMIWSCWRIEVSLSQWQIQCCSTNFLMRTCRAPWKVPSIWSFGPTFFLARKWLICRTRRFLGLLAQKDYCDCRTGLKCIASCSGKKDASRKNDVLHDKKSRSMEPPQTLWQELAQLHKYIGAYYAYHTEFWKKLKPRFTLDGRCRFFDGGMMEARCESCFGHVFASWQ